MVSTPHPRQRRLTGVNGFPPFVFSPFHEDEIDESVRRPLERLMPGPLFLQQLNDFNFFPGVEPGTKVDMMMPHYRLIQYRSPSIIIGRRA